MNDIFSEVFLDRFNKYDVSYKLKTIRLKYGWVVTKLLMVDVIVVVSRSFPYNDF